MAPSDYIAMTLTNNQAIVVREELSFQGCSTWIHSRRTLTELLGHRYNAGQHFSVQCGQPLWEKSEESGQDKCIVTS